MDLGSIPSRVKPTTLKLVFTASLLDVQHYRHLAEYKPASLLVVPLVKALSGIPHLKVADRWLATPKRACIVHWPFSRDRRINMQLNTNTESTLSRTVYCRLSRSENRKKIFWLIDFFIFILLSRECGGGAMRRANPDSLGSCFCFQVFRLNFLLTSLICCLPDCTTQRKSSWSILSKDATTRLGWELNH